MLFLSNTTSSVCMRLKTQPGRANQITEPSLPYLSTSLSPLPCCSHLPQKLCMPFLSNTTSSVCMRLKAQPGRANQITKPSLPYLPTSLPLALLLSPPTETVHAIPFQHNKFSMHETEDTAWQGQSDHKTLFAIFVHLSLPLALLLSPPTETVHVIPFQHNKFSMHETEDTAWQGQSDHKTLFAIFVHLSLPLALLLSPPTETVHAIPFQHNKFSMHETEDTAWQGQSDHKTLFAIFVHLSLPLALLLSPPTETVHVIPFQHNKFSMHETEDTAWQGQSDHKTLFAIFVHLSLPLALLLSPPTETVHAIPFQHNKFSMHETEDTAWQGQSDHKTLFAIFVHLSLPIALLLSPPTETALCRSPNPISPLHSCSFITAIRDYQSGHVEDIFT